MKKYKSVISFTGHSHLHFELQRISEYANIAMEDGEYGYRVHWPEDIVCPLCKHGATDFEPIK